MIRFLLLGLVLAGVWWLWRQIQNRPGSVATPPADGAVLPLEQVAAPDSKPGPTEEVEAGGVPPVAVAPSVGDPEEGKPATAPVPEAQPAEGLAAVDAGSKAAHQAEPPRAEAKADEAEPGPAPDPVELAEEDELAACPLCGLLIPVSADEGCGRTDCPIPELALAFAEAEREAQEGGRPAP